MIQRKIDKMQFFFGVTPGKKCRDCNHLKGGVNEYRKCECYGESASEATDWALKHDACGLWNKPYNGLPVIRTNKGSVKQPEEQIEGQMSFLDYND